MYVASLYPDRISVRWDHNRKSARTKWEEKQSRIYSNSLDNLQKTKSTWKLSYQTKRKIKDSVAYMSQLSKPRTIKTKSGKLIYNFKTSFITLTLPTPQFHSDIEIKQCLNNFLTTLRTRYNLKNYVWKAELQQNQNIHFHIITDIYIHHTVIRYYWNKALNTLGYVDLYAEKFKNLTLKEYAELRNIPIQQAINGFLYGRKTNWMSPGTEQVKAVTNSGMIGAYVAKYIVKDALNKNEVTEDDLERITNFGRVWGRSQSLSKINFVTRYCWDNLKQFLNSIDDGLNSFIGVEYDYCTVYYFNFQTITGNVSQWLLNKMKELAFTYNYIAPT